MSQPIRIDFVSDVVCPWCAVGLASLLRAMEKIGPGLQMQLYFQPFELNPDMPAEGESIAEHLGRKYGMSVEQLRQNSEALRQRAAALGFVIDLKKRDRIYNTFNAHRLLYWAGTQSRDAELALKLALLRAYHSEGRNVSDTAVLIAIAGQAGLDTARAAQVLASDEYSSEVRARENFYHERGISAVPSAIFNERHLIQGGQPPEAFEQALRQLSGIAAV
ncbi:MAG: DsbA family oxidoreductase [Chromatiales bacterium]|jgi:predicted DsbA family dithiol-disulfide isomerase|nr:DsbA family oxidoreductase [Chromatiales bacterium]